MARNCCGRARKILLGSSVCARQTCLRGCENWSARHFIAPEVCDLNLLPRLIYPVCSILISCKCFRFVLCEEPVIKKSKVSRGQQELEEIEGSLDRIQFYEC